MTSWPFCTSARKRRSRSTEAVSARSLLRHASANSAVADSIPTPVRTARPCTTGSPILVGNTSRAIAPWPAAIHATVQAMSGPAAADPESSRLSLTACMKPTTRTGPQPVTYMATANPNVCRATRPWSARPVAAPGQRPKPTLRVTEAKRMAAAKCQSGWRETQSWWLATTSSAMVPATTTTSRAFGRAG